MVTRILADLAPMEEQWGVRILQLGFSNLSPSPATLEITQLDLLARERQSLFDELCDDGVPDDVAVALVTGAVVATHPSVREPGLRDERRALSAVEKAAGEEYRQREAERRRAAREQRRKNSFDAARDDEEEKESKDEGDGESRERGEGGAKP
jgi:hypothetical protein